MVSQSIAKNPPAEIKESFSRKVIEFWKRYHKFPQDLLDPAYNNKIPIGYEHFKLETQRHSTKEVTSKIQHLEPIEF
jgi:hypothetical protein